MLTKNGERTFLVLNLFTPNGTGLDIYAKEWQKVYGKKSDYINLFNLNTGNQSYWMLQLKLFFGTEKKYTDAFQNIMSSYEHHYVHITDNPLFLFWILKQLIKFDKNIIVTLHDPLPHIEKSFLKKTIRYFTIFLNYKIYKLAEKTPHLFLHLHSQILKPIGWENRKIIFQQHPLVECSSEQDIFQLQAKKLVITFVGRLEYYKGIDVFCEAIKSIEKLLDQSQTKDVLFVIAGRGEISYRESDFKIDVKIINRFLSEEEFDSIIIYSDIIVLPYIEATQSGVLAKAVNAEKMVIVSNRGSLKDFVLEQQTGYVIEPTIKELESTLLKCINDVSMVKQFQKNTKIIKNNFSSANIIQNMCSKVVQ